MSAKKARSRVLKRDTRQLKLAAELIRQLTSAHSAREVEAEAALEKETGHNAKLLEQMADAQRHHDNDKQRLILEKVVLKRERDDARRTVTLLNDQYHNLESVTRLLRRQLRSAMQELRQLSVQTRASQRP